MQPFDTIAELRERVRKHTERLRQHWHAESDTAMTAFMRPNLGPTPKILRRVLEPVLAASALVTLIALAGIGSLGFAALFLAMGLIYLIITYVFGIRLDVNFPPAA